MQANLDLLNHLWTNNPSITMSDFKLMRVLLKDYSDPILAVHIMTNDLSFIRWQVHFREK